VGRWRGRNRLIFNEIVSKTVRSLTVHIYVLFLYWVGSGVSEVVALPREPKISDRSSDASEGGVVALFFAFMCFIFLTFVVACYV
jgi:hypothetical protein